MTSANFPKVNGNTLSGPEANNVAGQVIDVEAGETIAAGKVIYIHLTNGEAYVSDTGTADDIRANGIALTGGNDGDTIQILKSGLYTTSGLTAKQDYYLGASGAISTTLSGVRIGRAVSTTRLDVEIIQDDRDAVGTIKAYDISGATIPSNNLTAFWQLMDGTTISDSESPLNGDTMRDLNANNEFLRGGDTSGGNGGTATHFHNSAAGEGNIETTGGAVTSTVNHEPPYMDGAWIIKKN